MRDNKFIKTLTICLMLSVCLMLSACFQGKSAYEVAVENGFSGTEQQWLNSLQGRDGLNGQDADIDRLYQLYLEENIDSSFTEFLDSYLTIEYNPLQDAASAAIMSSVGVICEFDNSTSSISKSYRSAGSGVIYKLNQDGYTYIITNYHVVYDSKAVRKISDNISIFLFGAYNKESFISAKFVGGSPTDDIAVLMAKSSFFMSSAIKQVEVADSNLITAGQPAIAVGNPQAEGISVTSGIISVDSEYIEMDSITNSNSPVTQRVIRMDTSVNHGNSGGGLFDSYGKLIGIVNAKIVDNDVDSIGYAIPSNVAIGITENIIQTGGRKCVLGVATQSTNSKAIFDNKINRIYIKDEISVTQVNVGALAYGIVSTGDRFISARLNDGEELTLLRGFFLPDLMLNARSGDTLYLTVLRNNQQLTLTLKLNDSCLTNF